MPVSIQSRLNRIEKYNMLSKATTYALICHRYRSPFTQGHSTDPQVPALYINVHVRNMSINVDFEIKHVFCCLLLNTYAYQWPGASFQLASEIFWHTQVYENKLHNKWWLPRQKQHLGYR